mgnify:CR=1 FL=1
MPLHMPTAADASFGSPAAGRGGVGAVDPSCPSCCPSACGRSIGRVLEPLPTAACSAGRVGPALGARAGVRGDAGAVPRPCPSAAADSSHRSPASVREGVLPSLVSPADVEDDAGSVALAFAAAVAAVAVFGGCSVGGVLVPSSSAAGFGVTVDGGRVLVRRKLPREPVARVMCDRFLQRSPQSQLVHRRPLA